MLTVYTVNTIDSETPAAWMGAPHIVSLTAGAQDSGRCRYTVATSDGAALEVDLDADADVVEYSEIDTSPAPMAAQFISPSHLSSDFSRDSTPIERLMHAAGEHGDLGTVELCRAAIRGDQAALAKIAPMLR